MKKNRAAGETGVTPDVSHAPNMRVRVAHENNNNNNNNNNFDCGS